MRNKRNHLPKPGVMAPDTKQTHDLNYQESRDSTTICTTRERRVFLLQPRTGSEEMGNFFPAVLVTLGKSLNCKAGCWSHTPYLLCLYWCCHPASLLSWLQAVEPTQLRLAVSNLTNPSGNSSKGN
ncbi:hypothetical protein KIL84_018829 [Mauremys mutica]|uniref:Uncharacterized protein n=1 Tax=Mauremys mutica TaxID=74926 RepID=A0A9D3XVL0_9SAUR|nr:hypothetical protein KIL84_018829 [Mauremys mutica]